MYANQTFELIQQRKLTRVPNNRDKRQGSIIWDATATNSVEEAQMYIELDHILRLTFAETSYGPWLRKRVAELGIYPLPALKAKRLGIMYGADNTLLDIPIGSRFTIEALNYQAVERRSTGIFILECETLGIIGNQLFGRLIPVDNIRGLIRAELHDVIIPGQDEESDASLYARYEAKINMAPFGGNVDDYVLKIKSIDGVGGCEIYPVARGGSSVDVVIIDSSYNAPADILVARVQDILDPEPFKMHGLAWAPVGHDVLVLPVEAVPVDISVKVILGTDIIIGQVQESILNAIDTYLLSLRQDWERTDRLIPKIPIVIREAQIIAILINIMGILDVKDVKINGREGNLTIGINQVPAMGLIEAYE